jgi:hypothetical protein
MNDVNKLYTIIIFAQYEYFNYWKLCYEWNKRRRNDSNYMKYSKKYITIIITRASSKKNMHILRMKYTESWLKAKHNNIPTRNKYMKQLIIINYNQGLKT